MRVHTFAALARLVRVRPARLGRVRTVAVDGPSGAGKSTFADRLSEALWASRHATAVVRLDDFLDGWAEPCSVWPPLRSCVLDPLSAGRDGAYRPYDWSLRRFADATRVVRVPDVLILEGVTSARAAFRDRLSASVFVRAPESVRLERVLARDGAAIELQLRAWQRAESRYFMEEATEGCAEFVVDGAPTIEIDPRTRFVAMPRCHKALPGCADKPELRSRNDR